MITIQNYEEYFVRYLDGELSPEEVAEVKSFLQQHPHLNADLSAFRATMLQDDEQFVFPRKELLKKGITLVNYEEYFMKEVEGSLNEEERNEVKAFLNAQPQLQREYNAFRATKLVPELQVVFPDKKSLKKREDGRVVPMYVRYVLVAAVAASLMLILMMKGFQWQEAPQSVPLAQQNSSQANSTSDQQANRDNGGNVNESDAKVDNQSSQLAFNQHDSSASENKSHNRSPKKEAHNTNSAGSQLYADAFTHSADDSEFNSSASLVDADMNKLGNDILPINYQARFKKAQYREGLVGNSVVEAKPVKFSSVATALGSELLRLSGREDYIKGSSAFADNRDKSEKRPIAFSVKGEKFDFYHKFFKKRDQNNSSR